MRDCYICYTLLMELYRIYETGGMHQKVVILLAGWGNKQWMLWPVAQLLRLSGYHCLLVTYSSDVLSTDVIKTANSLILIADELVAKINTLKSEGKTEFAVFGNSLGSVVAVMLVNRCADIKTVILNSVGHDVAECAWSWDGVMSGFKQTLVDNGHTLSSLKKAWHHIAPANNLDGLGRCRFLIYLARQDEIIPYQQGAKLVESLQKRNHVIEVQLSDRLKHVPAAAYNLVRFRRYLVFLDGR